MIKAHCINEIFKLKNKHGLQLSALTEVLKRADEAGSNDRSSIPALGKRRQEVAPQVQGQPGIHSELQTSLGYKVKFCLNKTKEKKKNQK